MVYIRARESLKKKLFFEFVLRSAKERPNLFLGWFALINFLFRVQMVLTCLFVETNGRLTAGKKRFLTCVSCFGTLRGRGPFLSLCLSRRKNGTNGKAISGMSCTGEVKGPQSVATQL